MRVVIVPGMGCTPTADCNWYSWFAKKVTKIPAIKECVLRDFPDPYECKESIWTPFVLNDIGLDCNTILVGHSSGAACVMRLLESDQLQSTPILGAILVAAAYTDMGIEEEVNSQYFNRPWDWDKMKKGARKIVLFHGNDDELIPVHEARYIADQMKGSNFDYYEMKGKSHFFQPWSEILNVVDQMLPSS